MKRSVTILLIFILTISCTGDKEKVCTIKGEIVGRDCKTLIVYKSFDDFRSHGITIPVEEDHTFEYHLLNPSNERYSLVLEEDLAEGYLFYFFPDNKTIEFTLYPSDQYNKNEITGSPLTSELLDFEKEIRKSFEEKFKTIRIKHDSLRRINENNSALAMRLKEENASLGKEHLGLRIEYIKEDQTIIGYSMLIDMIQAASYFNYIDRNNLAQLAILYQNKFPNHRYTELSKNLITALTSIKVGGKYSNFSAVDLDGNQIDITEIIKSKKAILIDLWAVWCGPCLSKNRELVPLFLKYKDSGFEIISVVGGVKTLEEAKNIMEKEQYPWHNWLEINNQNKIWEKYNKLNTGGGLFLIDKNGVILAIDPSLEEVRKKLEDIL